MSQTVTIASLIIKHKAEIENEVAKVFMAYLKENIKNNSLGLLPNTISTSFRKKSSVPLVDSEEMVNNIVVEGNTVKMRDGVHKSGLSYEALAAIHEYGRLDKSIPARPAWEYALKKFEKENPKVVEQTVIKVLKRYVDL